MSRILYLNFIGARSAHERDARCLKDEVALAVLEGDLVVDCDKKAWQDGVRPGDTARQAKIASPACQVVRLREDSARNQDFKGLKPILDILSRLSPYVEPLEDGRGVFVDVSPSQSVHEALFPPAGKFDQAFIGESGSKLVAKAASDWLLKEFATGRKVLPVKTAWGEIGNGDGYLVATVNPGKERAYLSGAGLDSLWQATPDILTTLRSLGIKKVKDLREVPIAGLARHIGDWAFPIKKWACGEDRSPVKPLYPPRCLSKEVNFQEPVALVSGLFDPALQALASELVEKGIGFKSMRVTISGDFAPLTRYRTFVRPVSSLDAMKTALSVAMNDLSREESAALENPVISSFAICLDEIATVQAKPLALFGGEIPGEKRAMPVALSLAISGLEQKFGDEAVNWGRSEDRGMSRRPDIARRERMLSVWDPMRPSLQLSGAGDA